MTMQPEQPSTTQSPANPPVTPDFDRTALSRLEAENSGLRRLVVELIEKNQQLREQLQATASGKNAGTAADLRLVGARIAS